MESEKNNSEGNKVLNITYKILQNKDKEKIQIFFETLLPFHKFSDESILVFFKQVVLFCQELFIEKIILLLIFEKWKNVLKKDHLYDLIIYIFDNQIDNIYILNTLEITTFSFFKYIIENYDQFNNISYLFEKFESHSKDKITRGYVLNLLELSKTYENTEFVEFFKSIVNDKEDFCTKPGWVCIDEEEINLDPKFLLPDNWGNSEDLNLKESIDIISNDIKFRNKLKSSEEFDEDILEDIVKIAVTSFPECNTLEIAENTYISADRIFGPRNANINQECLTGIKGGCRMLSCGCVEENWFDEACDNCFKKIIDPSYAIRYPLEEGGWVGCYCGIVCMVKKLPREADKNTEQRLDLMVENIEMYGIYDRLKS